MRRIHLQRLVATLAATCVLVACGDDEDDQENQNNDNQETVEPFDDDCTTTVGPQDNAEENRIVVRTELDEAEEGDVICFVDGNYEFDDRLSVRVDGLELRGESRSDTRLDFSTQDSGAAGIDIDNTDDFQLRSLSVLNTPGNGVEFRNGDGVVFDDVVVEWEGEPDGNNGAYGLYPVESENIVVKNSRVYGAADAGIYLGQSEYGIIRDNEAHGNVAGIEVENSSYVAVYGNEAYDNTGGILIFNLPELERHYGDNTIVFGNEVFDNNRENFAPQGSGIVSLVPSGTGLLVLGVQDVRVMDNKVQDHQSLGLATISYDTLPEDYDDDDYHPHPERVDIFDNTVEDTGYDPAMLADQLIDLDPIPDVVWDGVYDDDTDQQQRLNCFSGNVDGQGEDASYGNLGVDPEEGDPHELGDNDCELEELDFDLSHLDE